MAARRIPAQLLTILQRSSVGNCSSSSRFEALAAPRQEIVFTGAGLHSEAQARNDNEHTEEYENSKMLDEGGGTVQGSYDQKSDELKQRQEDNTERAAKDVVSAGSQKVDEVKESVKEKSSAVGGKASEAVGQTKESLKEKSSAAGDKASEAVGQAKDKVKEKSSEVEGKASEAAGEAKGQVEKNVDTAKDMFKDFPQKVSETATGLKEVGVEAAKAVKRDTEKVAQKVGLKTD